VIECLGLLGRPSAAAMSIDQNEVLENFKKTVNLLLVDDEITIHTLAHILSGSFFHSRRFNQLYIQQQQLQQQQQLAQPAMILSNAFQNDNN